MKSKIKTIKHEDGPEERRVLLVVFTAYFFLKILFFLLEPINKSPDSYGYIARNGFDIFSLKIDEFRTPVYPFLIEVLQRLFGDRSGLFVLCVIQLGFSMFSACCFYKMLRLFKTNSYLCLVFTMLYAASTAVFGWDKTILTESLALSLTVFYMYHLLSYCFDPKVRHAAWCAVIVLLGTFLRPTFALFSGISLGFFLLRAVFYKSERWISIKCSAILSLPVAVILLYAAAFQAQHGFFTLSNLWFTQHITVVVEHEFYRNSTDSEIVAFIDEELTSYGWPEVNLVEIGTTETGEPNAQRSPVTLVKSAVYERFDHARVARFVKEALYRNPVQYVLYLCKVVRRTYNQSFSAATAGENGNLIAYLIALKLLPSYTFGCGILLAAIMCGFWLYSLLKRRHFSWIYFGLFVFIAAQYIISVIGTNAEFPRTAIGAVPFIVLALFILTNRLLWWIRGLPTCTTLYDAGMDVC